MIFFIYYLCAIIINFNFFTKMDKVKIFYTANEVAELLNVTSATVRNWLKSGTIPAIQVGSTWRIRKEAVDELING